MTDFNLSCPLPISERKTVVLGHGSGGKMSARLIRDLFLPAFGNEVLDRLDDQAVLSAGPARIAFTTDSFVVTPLFFPGGDIGKLAVHGTINDLAMSGAAPLALSAAFILEEGFPMEELERVVASMAEASRAAGVPIATGDTKVVPRGAADRMFVTTSGVGLVPEGVNIGARFARPGDRILLSGAIADHGMAVMSQREGLEFEGDLASDTAALHRLVAEMLEAGEIHAMRDPTRGGLGATLVEIAAAAGIGVEAEAAAIPVHDPARAACELLGIDPLFVANEGKLAAFVAPGSAERVLAAMRANPLGREAVMIGEAVAEHPGLVLLRTEVGGRRIVDLPLGEQLPRIC
ncbi:MAG TPA: hydrogenase expression/formation protein HypE [Bryobacteraceae bacterium]|nr:hydrogenase expression/formation protein HypE [Bryobacteraceae bacterium]